MQTVDGVLALYGLALAIAVVSRFLPRISRSRRGSVPERPSLALAGLFAASAFAGWLAVSFTPVGAGVWDTRFALPLVISAAALVPYLVPRRAGREHGTADLTPRRSTTFLSRGWGVATASATAAALGIALVAGSASVADDNGLYRAYVLHFGDASASTEIYGWYYSASAMVLLAVIIGLLALALIRIARPAWTADRRADEMHRRQSAINALRIALGGILIHLAVVCGSLFSTTSIEIGTSDAAVGEVSTGTGLAALSGLFAGATAPLVVAGLTLWFSTALTALPTRKVDARR